MSTAKEKEALAGVEGMASSASVVHLMGPAPSQSDATVKLIEGASHAADMNRYGAYPGASRTDMAYQSRAYLASSPVVGSQPVPFVPTGKVPALYYHCALFTVYCTVHTIDCFWLCERCF